MYQTEARSDEEIDTSDITLLEERFWANAVRFRDRALYRPVKQSTTVRLDADVLRWLEGPDAPDHVDLVVLDPPRTGAKRRVVEQVVRRTPRAVAYVACDPAALARDLALFAERGYHLESLRALDLFPMTSHVEVVAKLVKCR